MSATKPNPQKSTTDPPKKSGKGKLIIVAVPALLALTGAGLWFTGVLPRLLGLSQNEKKVAETAKPVPPSYIDIPDLIDNLSDPYGPHYVKLDARVVVPKPGDVALVTAAMPRLQNLLVVYMRDMKVEELHDAADTDRLRAELVVRVNTAVAPAKVSDVLFKQLLVQ